MTITPRVKLKDDDAFSTLFTITNEGAFAIRNVRFSCHMNNLEIRNYHIVLIEQEEQLIRRENPRSRVARVRTLIVCPV